MAHLSSIITYRVEVVVHAHKTSLEQFLKDQIYEIDFEGNNLVLSIRVPRMTDLERQDRAIVAVVKLSMEERRALAVCEHNEIANWLHNNAERVTIHKIQLKD